MLADIRNKISSIDLQSLLCAIRSACWDGYPKQVGNVAIWLALFKPEALASKCVSVGRAEAATAQSVVPCLRHQTDIMHADVAPILTDTICDSQMQRFPQAN